MVLTAATGACMGVTGLPFYSIGLMIRPLAAEFGWSRAALGGAALCLQMGIVLSAPFTGRLVDRFGLRRIALASLFGLALTAMALPRMIGGLGGYYGGWLVLSLAGCGTTPLIWTRSVVGHFHKARGLALGLTLLGTGIAGVLAPALIGTIIHDQGWRAGCRMLGLLVLFVALPVAFLFLRDPPPIRQAKECTALSIGDMARNAVFRRLAAAFLLLGLSVTALIVHLVPLLADRGLSDGQALRAASTLGLAVMGGRVLVGALVDRLPATRVAFCFLVLPVSSCAILLAGRDFSTIAVILLGLAAGAEIDLLAFFVGRYFALDHYGAVYGTALALFSLGAGLGPIVAGLSYDLAASYVPMLCGAPLLIAAGAWLIFGLDQYRHRAV